MTVTIRGLEKTGAAFRALNRHTRRNVSQAIRKTADAVEAGSETRAPVDEGTLRGDIDVHPTEHDLVYDVGIAATDESAVYAPIVHFGDPGTRTGKKRRANPFLFNAMEAERPDHDRRVAAAVEQAGRAVAE